MNDGLQCRYASNVPVEEVERREVPACQPDEDVISAAKHPD